MAKVLINILIILIVLAVLILIISYLMVQLAFVRNKSQIVDVDDRTSDDIDGEDYKLRFIEAIKGREMFMSRNPESVEITSFDGLKLKGWLLKAPAPTDKVMICIHGYRAYGLFEFGDRMEYLLSLGYNLLIPDDRAHGRSEGKYIGFGNLDALDAVSWCRFALDKFGEDSKLILHGVSMGGATVLSACSLPDAPSQIRAVCADCGFSSGYKEASVQISDLYHMPKHPFLPIATLILKLLSGNDIRERSAVDLIPSYKGKLLIIHGGSDTFVPTYMAQEIFDAASCDKDILIIPNAGHALAYLKGCREFEEAFDRLLQDL